MAELARRRFTFAEYVQIEDMSRVKHEFLDGVIYAMSGGSPDHAGIAANVIALLGQTLGSRPCRVFSSDLRVRVPATGLGTYPDASVVCGQLELDSDDPKGHTVVNPTLLVEVLSPSTEDYDRGEKLAQYRQIPALREVLLIAHDDRRVDLWRRETGWWTQLVFRAGDAVDLTSLNCSLAVDDIYRDPLAS